MSLKLYDTALLEKIQKWTDRTNLHVYSPNDSKHIKEVMLDERKDENIVLPFIAISRDDGYTLNNYNKIPMTFSGKKIYSDEDRVVTLNAIPITINYNIDVYTRYLDEVDAYVREIVFNIINYPKLEITIPYLGINMKHYSNIRLSSYNISDVSAMERITSDDITCYRIQINIDDAYLWDVRARATAQIVSDDSYVEIHSDDVNQDVVLEPLDVSRASDN